jgi:CO/xanthine dehydrogenase FAD-binding subunit
MKPPPFRYYRARSLAEAVDFLNGPAAGGKLLAGGQSLVPLLNLRLARPDALVDLNPIQDLSYIRKQESEIAIGALTRHREMEFSGLLAEELPILTEAIPQIGHPAIRNRGTLGGSLAHADPAAELPCVLTALDAKLVAGGAGGERVIRAEDFFVGYYATTLSEKEILKEVRISLSRRPAGWSFVEFARRHGDFALAETAVLLFADQGGERCASARLVVGGAVERPLRITAVEKLVEAQFALGMARKSFSDFLMEVEQRTREEIQVSEHGRDDSDYFCHLAGVLARRAFENAVDRWRRQ